jgi:alpha-methylacyl-CoA racemase
VSIGSIESQFYAELLKHTGLEGEELPWQHDRAEWPALKERLAAIFRTKTRDEWCEIMEGTDVCFAPVLSMGEAPHHPHNVHRETFIERDGVVQPAPAPRFSRTLAEVQRPPAHAGQHTDELLVEAGFDADRIAKLREAGAIA